MPQAPPRGPAVHIMRVRHAPHRPLRGGTRALSNLGARTERQAERATRPGTDALGWRVRQLLCKCCSCVALPHAR